MAAGKTTLGRYAARQMGREFIDLDRYIEARFRKSIPDIFAEEGEARFRELERRMLHEVGEFDNVLVATGGGTPCFYDNMAYMKSRGVVAFLSCSVGTICRRVRASKSRRPLLTAMPPEALAARVEAMLGERMPYYSQATLTLCADRYERQEALAEATAVLQAHVADACGG